MTSHYCRALPGICHSCKNPARPGRTRCAECAEKERIRGIKYRQAHPEDVKASWARYRASNKAAMRARTAAWREANSEKVGKKHLARYGIEPEHYEVVNNARRYGFCAICGRPASDSAHKCLDVDHSHITGNIRGLLCHKCNMGLGCFDDSPKILLAAVDYLRARS
jgi:hypothetical protein